MKKISLASVTAAALAMPAIGFAQNLPGGAAPVGTGVEPIVAILNKVGNWMFAILLAVAAVYILLAAFKFLTGGGDEKKVTEARRALTYALVAVVVGALTKGLIEVAKAIAGGAL
ncbi:MAG: hypothetical protein UT41_C0002G0007 [Candidatus Wolfebacteria bacterium GW2011_GWC2_39_22]|uniref:TrbC/VIRB2 family protein n=1 Tax=Candidatus Wolfebacteria bacterium GW2011_GWC2_39_22 TaxID=1619013 RepID=A0A0G0N9V5_9BACT|nr:MAG: hypothetical protein UT41_C0002G0007 [Candidatus Wolfebacteria bacterium GW2011_GWC2_39_22]HBI25868.1 hypothetical protein [Candidatus Wolfebacteria bacterium]